MYGGLDKYGGDLVGSYLSNQGITTVEEACDTAGAEETLVGKAPLPDGGTKDVLLTASINTDYGGLKWEPVEDATETLRGVVSMSQMTSMLHDTDRNSKYDCAITAAVEAFTVKEGRPPVVLDIGTGTGLLAMMAVRAGASKVYACEMFEAMAKIAEEVCSLNFPEGQISVLAKKSTELTVGEGGDLPARADLLVTEIFDSALLGEAVLPALRDARHRLLAPGAPVVPRAATVYAALAAVPQARALHDLEAATLVPGGTGLAAGRPPCGLAPPPIPVQARELDPAPAPASETFELLAFDFAEGAACLEEGEGAVVRRREVPVTRAGMVDSLLLHWELELWEGVVYSTEMGKENWQDHWLQVVIPFRDASEKAAGETVALEYGHTDLALFCRPVEGEPGAAAAGHATVGQEEEVLVAARAAKRRKPGSDAGGEGQAGSAGGAGAAAAAAAAPPGTECGCGLHLLLPPERVAQLGCAARRDAYGAALAAALGAAPGARVVLDVADGSYAALLAAARGAGAALSLEPKALSRLLCGQLARAHGLGERVSVWPGGEDWPFLTPGAAAGEAVPVLADVLAGEPHYYQMQHLPLWAAANFWYLRSLYQPVLRAGAAVVPRRARVRGVPVELPDLSRSHGAVGAAAGFDHAPLDRCQAGWAGRLYPYPLWQYRFRPLAAPRTLAVLEYQELVRDAGGGEVVFAFAERGTCHACLFWVDYELGDGGGVWSGYPGPGAGPERGKQMLRFLGGGGAAVAPAAARDGPGEGEQDGGGPAEGGGAVGALRVRAAFVAATGKFEFEVALG